MRTRVVCLLAFAFLPSIFPSHAISQSAPASTTPATAPSAYAIPGCAVDRTQPSDADRALWNRHYADAERLYSDALAANANSTAAMAGLVHAVLGEGKQADALALAQKNTAAHPNDPLLLDALGEVRFRRGEVHDAAVAINQSSRLNPCIGRTHYEAARFLNLSGMYATAQRELEMAHALAPGDLEISRLWVSTHAVPPTPEQRLETLKQRLSNPSLNEEQKAATEAAIKALESHQKGTCELVTPVEHATVPILPIYRDPNDQKGSMYEAEVALEINGRKRRFEVDTGASGLVLNHAAAKAAGLIPEATLRAGGIGSDRNTVYVSHVDDIKVGPMEFRNCMVRVAGGSLDLAPDVDGLIGPDVFSSYAVTLDYPSFEMRLDPLPPRPGENGIVKSLATSTEQETLSPADRARDRYIAPAMKDWTPFFRAQHMLIVPTGIGDAPTKLFLMDSGSQRSMISPEAAKEVTVVSKFTNSSVSGINGKVQNIMVAEKVQLKFAGIGQQVNHMDAFDLGGISRAAGVDISGLIGFPALRQLVISIDYRDNLVHVVYNPKKGYHAPDVY